MVGNLSEKLADIGKSLREVGVMVGSLSEKWDDIGKYFRELGDSGKLSSEK